MASINGLTIKNPTTWLGREGYATQGDLYLGDEKIGFWSQDGNGGEDRYELEEKYSDIKLYKVVKQLYKDKVLTSNRISINYDIDLLMSDLLELQEMEKEYRKNFYYNDNTMAVILNPYFRKTIKLPPTNRNVDDELIKLSIKKEIDKFRKEHGSDDIEVKIFRSYKDFDIGTPIKKEDLYNFQKLKDVFKWDTLILKDRTIKKENFSDLDLASKDKLSNIEVICSNKSGCYYEKDYFLQFNREDKSNDEIELGDR